MPYIPKKVYQYLIFLIIGISIAALFYRYHSQKQAAPIFIESAHLVINNFADATEGEIDDLVSEYEISRKKIIGFLKKSPPSPTTISLNNECSKPPNAFFGRINLNKCDGKLYIEPLLHELVHLTLSMEKPIYLMEGIATYVDLIMVSDSNFPFYEKNCDDWVSLAISNNREITLNKLISPTSIMTFDFNGSSEDANSWLFYLESCSIVGWIIKEKGWNTFWNVYHSGSLLPFVGNSVIEIELEWRAYLKKQNPQPFSCNDALSTNSSENKLKRYKHWCELVEGR